VRDALEAAGVSEARIHLEERRVITGSGATDEARRVEVALAN
jgi:hypothetical protein